MTMAISLRCTPAAGKAGPPIPAHKKIIGFAINALDASTLSSHIKDLDARLALDGLVIYAYPNGWPAEKRTGQEGMLFGGHAYEYSNFSEALHGLTAQPLGGFTDNFLQVDVAARGSLVTGNYGDGNIQWDDDARWSGVVGNAKAIARLAKDAQFKGLFLDVEAYGGEQIRPGPCGNADVFEYDTCFHERGLTHAAQEDTVRRRGREFMEAVTSVFPGITIVVIQNAGWNKSTLVKQFVMGMMAGRGRDAEIVDGGEDGYSCITHRSFRGLHEAARQKYKGTALQELTQAYAVWLEGVVPDEYGGWATDGDLQANYRTPEEFAATLYGALTEADEYVWLYVWHPQLWFAPGPTIRKQCCRCPHVGVPQGYLDALVDSRHEHDLDYAPPLSRDRVVYFDGAAAVAGADLLEHRNGDFEAWIGANTLVNWTVAGHSPVVTPDECRSTTARLSFGALGGDHVYLEQELDPAPLLDKTIMLTARVKYSGTIGEAYIGIQAWQSAEVHPEASSESHPGDGQWHELSVVVPPISRDTRKLRIRLSLKAANHSGDLAVNFDDAVVVAGSDLLNGTGDFETWAGGPSGWSLAGQGLVIDMEQMRPVDGTTAFGVSTNEPLAHVWAEQEKSASQLLGKRVILATWVRSTVPGASPQILAMLKDDRHTVFTGDTPPADGEWHLVSVTAEPLSADTRTVRLRLGAQVPFMRPCVAQPQRCRPDAENPCSPAH